jgi:hypothetical protein
MTTRRQVTNEQADADAYKQPLTFVLFLRNIQVTYFWILKRNIGLWSALRAIVQFIFV